MNQANVEIQIICDLKKNTASPSVISINQNESNVKKIKMFFLDNGEPWQIPDGCSCNIMMQKADGFIVYNPAIEISGNSAVFEITKQMTIAVGDNLLQAQIRSGERDMRSSPAVLNVKESVSYDNSILSQSEKKTINQLISEAENVIQATQEAVKIIDNWKILFETLNAGAHNAIYRGKLLGSAPPTDEQYTAIAAGTFDDLYIGDYWTIDGVNYRIAAFDYYLNCGDTAFAKHHAVIVPDTVLYDYQMNDTDTTDGAYVGSKMYMEGLEQAKTIIKAAFSGHVLSHRIYLNSAVSNGRVSVGKWYDSEVDLMCEQMVYGSGIFSPVSDGSTVPLNYRVEKSQLPLFKYSPSRLIAGGKNWSLRDVISNRHFAGYSRYGNVSFYDADYFEGVRPAFCIG